MVIADLRRARASRRTPRRRQAPAAGKGSDSQGQRRPKGGDLRRYTPPGDPVIEMSACETLDTDLANSGRFCLRGVGPAVLDAEGSRWLGSATAADEAVLGHVVGPVLDVGCDPGRHVVALRRRCGTAVGLDVTLSAVALARSRGAAAIDGSVFAPVPGAGTWATVLLLDGNIGIGGDPVALLRRVGELLVPGGLSLAELTGPGCSRPRSAARVDHDGRLGPWFDWATVSIDDLAAIATAAGVEVSTTVEVEGRWFVRMHTAVAQQPVAAAQ